MRAVVVTLNGIRMGPPTWPTNPPGSMSSYEPDGRQLYLFGWIGENGPGIWRSAGGVDIELRAHRDAGIDYTVEELRLVSSSALEPVHDLDAGPFDLPVILESGALISVRLEALELEEAPLN